MKVRFDSREFLLKGFCVSGVQLSRTHLPQVLLHELRANHSDECCSGVMSDGLCKHCFAGAGWAPQQDAPGRVDANLSVQLMMSQRQLHGLLDLLLLNVVPTNVLYRATFLLPCIAHAWRSNFSSSQLVTVESCMNWMCNTCHSDLGCKHYFYAGAIGVCLGSALAILNP